MVVGEWLIAGIRQETRGKVVVTWDAPAICKFDRAIELDPKMTHHTVTVVRLTAEEGTRLVRLLIYTRAIDLGSTNRLLQHTEASQIRKITTPSMAPLLITPAQSN